MVALLLFSAVSCCDKPEPDTQIQLSVLIYIAADNSLGKYRDDYANIEQLKQGFLPSNGNIVVYHDAYDAPPRLFRLVKGSDGAVDEELIEQYPEENSADPQVLTRSLILLRDRFPANDYGLILWSHGTGWLPKGEYSKYYNAVNNYPSSGMVPLMASDQPRVKSFGEDGNDVMEIEALAASIPYRLSFVIFDACLMGGIEVAYAMRHTADYIVASPTEIITDGFPYHHIMQPLFEQTPNLKAVCNAFYNYYNDKSGSWKSATIALYHTEGLTSLAATVRSIFDAHRETLNAFVPHRDLIQCYDRLSPGIFFDLAHFISIIATPAEYSAFESELSKTVIHKRATPMFLTIPIDPDRYSGVAAYIPNGLLTTRQAFRETEWNRAVRLME